MPAVFLGCDTVSRGAGSRGLGRHGYTHSNMSGGPTVVNGTGVSLAWAAGATAFTDFASVADPDRYLLLPDGVSTTSRVITRAFNPAARLAVTASDAAWRVVSAYCFAGAPGRMSMEIRLPGSTTGPPLASYTVPVDYQLGQWFRFAFDESADIVFALVSSGGPAAIAGVYFDPHPVHLAGPPPSNAFGHFAQ